MSFSEKMRKSLGTQGVRLYLHPLPNSIRAGRTTPATLELRGGPMDTRIERLIIRIMEADRYWMTADGHRHADDEVRDLPDRTGLSPSWDRQIIYEQQRAEIWTVEAGTATTVDLAIDVPDHCRPSSVSCTHMLNVQADVRGQIDPSANLKIHMLTAG